MAAQPTMTATQRQSIEFIVKPTEDLFLEGSLRRLPRVVKGEAYPCQMQKNQTFSCLFRHYAKHNGLRKEDLVFSFVDELLPDQTPEGVHLMQSDEIYVSLRKITEKVTEPIPPEKSYSVQFKKLLSTGAHSDVTFVLDEGRIFIPSHKAILSARSEYFESMLRVGGMSESLQSEISINHDALSFRRMLEFIYTNEIGGVDTINAEEMLNMLLTANQYVMEDLRIYMEPFAAKLLATDNIAKFLLLSAEKDSSVMKEACINFIYDHKQDLAADNSFYQEVESNPELGLLLFKYAVNADGNDFFASEDDPLRKRRRFSSGSDVTMRVISSQPANCTNTIAHSNTSVHDV